jgi:hypothetical protein
MASDSGTVDYASLWTQLRSRVEYGAKHATEDANRAGRPWENRLTEFHQYRGEADALSRVLVWMDEMGCGDY